MSYDCDGLSAQRLDARWRVLVFPGGTEGAIEIYRALRSSKEVTLFAAGQNVPSAAEFCFRRFFEVPPVSDPSWIWELEKITREQQIDFIYPTHDDVLLALARHQPPNVCVLGSPQSTCEITRSKSQTYKCLRGAVPVPDTYRSSEVATFPVFVKPDRGQGSVRARRVDDQFTLACALKREPDLLVSEWLPGEEYTIDCFTNSRRELLFARGRVRLRVRAGIAMQSRLVLESRFKEVAQSINERIELRGAWFFQMKRDAHGQLKLLEVGPRIAGTMALNRVTGVNFPLLTIFDAAGLDVQVNAFETEMEISRSLENHYRCAIRFSAVYVDLDDTLIVCNQVNTDLVKFLYQCLNQGKKVSLITRHVGDLQKKLKHFRLTGLFDEVHHIDDLQCKSGFIPEADAIFIDDSFSERQKVSRACNILTFESSAIECLIDDRA